MMRLSISRLAMPTRSGLRHVGLIALALVAARPAAAEVFEITETGMVSRDGAGLAAAVGEEAADTAVDAIAPEVPMPALTLVGLPSSPFAFQAPLLEAARRYDVSPELLAALVWQESRWRPGALSSKGAIGLGQLMPATARALAVDPRDAGANLSGAAHYLRQMLDLFDGDIERALAAYNAGPARVLKAGGIPHIAETQAYVAAIMDRLAVLKSASLSGSQP